MADIRTGETVITAKVTHHKAISGTKQDRKVSMSLNERTKTLTLPKFGGARGEFFTIEIQELLDVVALAQDHIETHKATS